MERRDEVVSQAEELPDLPEAQEAPQVLSTEEG